MSERQREMMYKQCRTPLIPIGQKKVCLYTRGYYIENGERKGVLISGVSLERGSTVVKQMGEMENEGERERERD